MNNPATEKIKLSIPDRGSPQPDIDFDLVEARVKPADLAAEWSGGDGPFFFRRAPSIVVRKGDARWLDPVKRRTGVGAISIAAHVLERDVATAAWLVAEFAAIRDGLSIEAFMRPMTLDEAVEMAKSRRPRWGSWN